MELKNLDRVYELLFQCVHDLIEERAGSEKSFLEGVGGIEIGGRLRGNVIQILLVFHGAEKKT